MESGEERGGSTAYVLLLTLVAALGGLLFGYDTAVISGAIGFLETHFHLGAGWKAWMASSALVGCALGAAMAGLLSDRLGRKKMLVISALLFLISAVGTALPRDRLVFVIFRIIGGLGIGAASMSSPMYIAEISPARSRGRLVSVNQFAIVSGILLAYFINYLIATYGAQVDKAAEVAVAATASWNVEYGWRWMFGSGALPAGLFLVLLLLVPESPRWLTKQGRRGEALDILTRVGGRTQAAAELADIEDAIQHESGSLAQLFQPGMRTVFCIGVTLAILQQVTGINVFLYFAPEIFKKMGSSIDAALLQVVCVGAVNLSFTVIAIWTVDLLGRKPLMLIGAVGMGLTLTVMGLAAYQGQTATWLLLCILGYIACFALSVGPVVWVILSEIFPTRIRGRAMAIATVCLWTANYVVTQTFVLMDESQPLVAKFHHGLPYWIYAGFCVVLVVFVWYWVPETKGKSLEEIERGWLRSS